jgi:hypothetical protein
VSSERCVAAKLADFKTFKKIIDVALILAIIRGVRLQKPTTFCRLDLKQSVALNRS